MKKILSLTLALLMVVSAVPMVHAAGNWEGGTAVTYTATGTEAYTVTVPAELAPGGSGEVNLTGTWASNRKVIVSADDTVTLTNDISGSDEKVLNVSFRTIEAVGNNNQSLSVRDYISVEEMPSDALFGTWSGKFNYNVEIGDVAPIQGGQNEPN